METTTTLAQYRAALAVLAGLPHDITTLRQLTDTDLLDATRLHTDASRLLGTAGAALAGELAHRSRPELGGEGLARRTGHRTVETLLKATTGATRQNVATVLSAGTLMVEVADEGSTDAVSGVVCVPARPWLRAVAEAVGAGQVSTDAAKSIASGVGAPNSAVTEDQLADAVTTLIGCAVAGMDADRLFRQARDLRNEMDLAGVRVREEELWQARSLRHFPLPTGGGRAVWDMDTESYALFTSLFDRAVSPKLGTVRFVDETQKAHAQEIQDDPRSPTQLASDTFMQLLTAGAHTDSSRLLGTGAPIIRITVAEPALHTGEGLARIDGQAQPISLTTVERLLCTGTPVTVGVDAFGAIIETESEQRLFSSRQKEALAAKFGGCMDPNCQRPPSWCETHHIKHWARDGGKTITSNGILLCKYHHLLYHNRGYEIEVDNQGNYWKIPPTSIDPAQTPIPMPLKTRNLSDLAAATQRVGV